MLLNRAIPFLRKKMPVRGTDRARSRSRSRSLERTDQTHTKEGAPIDKPVGDSETPARVLNCLTIAEKDALCKFKATSPSTGNTALKAYAKAQFGKEPSSSQISRILQEPHKWAVQEGRVNARKVRNGKWPTLEAALNVAFSQVDIPPKVAFLQANQFLLKVNFLVGQRRVGLLGHKRSLRVGTAGYSLITWWHDSSQNRNSCVDEA